jgi:predicted transcriptional regulator
MLTVSDFIHLIQYYYNHPSKIPEIQTIEIAQLKSKGYTKEWLESQQCSIHPMTTLHAVALLMAKTKAHRIPLVTENSEIISVITQYRLMKFIANNVKKKKKKKWVAFFGIWLGKEKKTGEDKRDLYSSFISFLF